MFSFRSRSRAVGSSRANLALVVAGCLLVLLAPAWRLAVAPALRIVPTDIEQVLYYDGTLTRHSDPVGGPPAGGEPVRARVRIEREELSKPLLSTPGTAVVEVETRVRSPETLELISRSGETYRLDRKTGEMIEGSEAGRMSGYMLVFPFDTPRGTVRYWSELAGESVPARFVGTERSAGLVLYRFRATFRDREAARPPEGYPRRLTGAGLKLMLSMPGLPVPDEAEGRVSYTAAADIELLVEPRAGNVVDIRGRESISLESFEAGGGGALELAKPLYELEYEQQPASFQRARRFAASELAKFGLQYTYIPLGLAGLGLLLLVVGFAALPRAGGERGPA